MQNLTLFTACRPCLTFSFSTLVSGRGKCFCTSVIPLSSSGRSLSFLQSLRLLNIYPQDHATLLLCASASITVNVMMKHASFLFLNVEQNLDLKTQTKLVFSYF